MNNLKSKAGFTLVELIVVIAILAILAGVGTAAYTGYITKANQSADDSQIVAINQALQATAALNGKQVSDLTVTVSGTAVSEVKIGTTDVTTTYNGFYTGNTVAFKYYTGLTQSAGVVSGTKTN